MPPTNRSSGRYDTTGNPEADYIDDARTVLRNKLGITDAVVLQMTEEQALVRAYERIIKGLRVTTPITCELIRDIHRSIFGDLYDWAGRWRTVWIRKPGTTWPPPDFLDQNMVAVEREVLAKHVPRSLTSDDLFCRAVAEIQGEFLVIHPFREGNARTIKLATDIFALQTGRPFLVYDNSSEGTKSYTAAAKAAFKRDYAPLTDIIRHSLQRPRSPL